MPRNETRKFLRALRAHSQQCCTGRRPYSVACAGDKQRSIMRAARETTFGRGQKQASKRSFFWLLRSASDRPDSRVFARDENLRSCVTWGRKSAKGRNVTPPENLFCAESVIPTTVLVLALALGRVKSYSCERLTPVPKFSAETCFHTSIACAL